MRKSDELVRMPNTTMYFPKIELTEEEIDRLYRIGHVVPSWLRFFVINIEDLEAYLKNPPARLSKREALALFVTEHMEDPEMVIDMKRFSRGELELIDLSVKYGLFFKDVRKIFKQCLPKEDVNSYWKMSKKHQQKKTTQTLYGVSHSSKHPEVAKKRKDTMMERYGVDHNMKCPKLRQSFVDGMVEKHGFKYAFEPTVDKVVDNWIDKLFTVLDSDKKWREVLQEIAKKEGWDYDKTIFDIDHLHIQHRNFVISKGTNESVDKLLHQYVEMTGERIAYPTNTFFQIPVGICFNKTWLRYYNNEGFVLVSDESLFDKVSRYEVIMMNLLDEHGIPFQTNLRKKLEGLEMDFYFPEKRIGLEISPNISHNSNDYATMPGRQMFTSKKDSDYHYEKYKRAEEKGITLIQWFGNDLDETALRNKSFPRLLSKLNGYDKKLTSHQLDVRKLSADECVKAKAFIQKYHSIGDTPAPEYWGFYDKNELVGSATFEIKGNHAELKRICYKPGVKIVDGLTIIIQHFFCAHQNIEKVISFSDNNHGNGNGYERAGANLVSETGPFLRFISHSDPNDMYPSSIQNGWDKEESVIYQDTDGRVFHSVEEVIEYIERELSHQTDDKKGYDRIYTAGFKKWEFTRNE